MPRAPTENENPSANQKQNDTPLLTGWFLIPERDRCYRTQEGFTGQHIVAPL